MSPAHVLEPTYHEIKRSLMLGIWLPGEKLEALRLADELGVSMTPVRDALNRLAGERLVDMKPGDGYRVPRIAEKTLREMLNLSALLLDFALRCAVMPNDIRTATDELDYAERVSALFEIIVSQSGNITLTEVSRSLSERMHSIRRLEPIVLPDAGSEIAELERSATQHSPALPDMLRRFHDRRHQKASLLIL